MRVSFNGGRDFLAGLMSHQKQAVFLAANNLAGEKRSLFMQRLRAAIRFGCRGLPEDADLQRAIDQALTGLRVPRTTRDGAV